MTYLPNRITQYKNSQHKYNSVSFYLVFWHRMCSLRRCQDIGTGCHSLQSLKHFRLSIGMCRQCGRRTSPSSPDSWAAGLPSCSICLLPICSKIKFQVLGKISAIFLNKWCTSQYQQDINSLHNSCRKMRQVACTIAYGFNALLLKNDLFKDVFISTV